MRLARQLAMAHRIEREIEAGAIAHHAQAARILGVTRARMSQIAALYLLPAEMQDAIQIGHATGTERSI